jgi:dienelactone hydrolase
MRAPGDPPFYTSASWSEREVEIRLETMRGLEVATVTRLYPWVDLENEEVTGAGVEGHLWLPSTDTMAPALIRLGGWGDGSSALTSSLLAARGFAVLDLGYHQRPNLPEELVHVPVETISRAVDWLQAHPRVDSARIAVFGVSKGAELALLAAAHEPRLGAVVAWSPASVAFMGISFRDPTPGSSWSLAGEGVPFAAAPFDVTALRNSARFLFRRPVSLRAAYEAGLATARPAARLPVERIAGPILLAAGTDDRMWPSARMTRELTDRLAAAGFPHRVVSVIAEGAGHRIDFSLWPSGGGPSQMFVRGGDPEADHLAGRRAWSETLRFLEEDFARGGGRR